MRAFFYVLKLKGGETVALFEVNNLSLEIGGAQILDSLTFQIEKGSFTCIIGPNGAGKSSLLACMGGLNRAFGGTVLLDGRSLASMSEKETARRIAWLHQSGSDFLPFAVREFAAMSRYPWHNSFAGAAAEDEQIVDNALKTAGVSELADRKLNTLSGGECRRALLAAALAQGTDILFLDEPANFLDYKYQEELLALVEKINREQGVTVVCVTHDANFALHCADCILAVKSGRLVWSGDSDSLLSQKALARLFETEFAEFKSGGRTVCVAPEGLLR